MVQRCLSCMQMTEGGDCPHCGYPGKVTHESHQLTVGTMLRDRYQIGKVLGQGGFGITYLGWDTLMCNTVAVKEFYPAGTVFRRTSVSSQVECSTEAMVPHYEYSRERFLREARALVDFKDIPEVVDILDFIEANNTAYIVMEFVRGVDLAKYIQRKGGRLSVEETFRILRPVMEALARVHKGGVVHRDISPDNIILDPMGGAKLLDFGAVRAVEDPDVEKGLNKSTEAILKQGFAPIEQYNTRGSLGPWTDEYAMCATVWYCLTGRVPEEASIRMSEGIDPDWSSIEGLPVHQQKALEKGFSCRAKDRYKSLDELLAALFPETAPVSSPDPVGSVPISIPYPVEAAPVSIPETVVEPAPVRIPEPVKEAPVRAVKETAKPRKKSRKKSWLWAIPAVLAVLIAVAVFLPKGAKTVPEETVPEDTTPAQIQTQPTQTEETEPLSPEEEAYLHAEALLEEGKLGEAAIAFGQLAGYSDARERSFAIWDQITAGDTVSAGGSHIVGIKTNGTVVATGKNDAGQCNVGSWTDIVAVSAGDTHTVGLRADGTVVAVGSNSGGQCDVSSWSDIIAISAGGSHTVGIKADRTVVAVGSGLSGQCDVSGWTDIVAVSAGVYHTVGVRIDGTAVAAGSNSNGQCDVSRWTNIMAVSAAGPCTVGLKTNGTVVAVGKRYSWTSDWSSNIVAISAGASRVVGLRADGTVASDEEGSYGTNKWTDIVAISQAGSTIVGLRSDGTVVTSNGWLGDVSGWTDIMLPKGRVPSAEAEKTEPLSAEAEAYAHAEALLAEGKLGEAAIAFGKLAGFSDARERSFEVWERIAARDTVCTSIHHAAGLKNNGTVVAVGDNYDGQCAVSSWSDIVALSSGETHTVGLRADGTVVAAGTNYQGQCDVSGWSDIVAVAAGKYHTVGLRADGTVVTTSSSYGDVSGWTNIVAISSGQSFTVGLRADGTVVATGEEQYGQCDVNGWSDIVAIEASYFHTVGLRADGTVVATGKRSDGQCDVGGWSDIVAVAASEFHTVGLRANGTVVAAGGNYQGQCDVSGWTNVVAVSAGGSYTMGLRDDGTMEATRWNASGQHNVYSWTDIRLPKERIPFR